MLMNESHGVKQIRCRHCTERGDGSRLSADLVPRLRRILRLHLHPLKGARRGQWSVRVSGNWRVVFRFEGAEAVDVDLIDYH